MLKLFPWAKKIAHTPHQKSPPHQIAIFMKSPKTSFIYRCSYCCCFDFFNFRLYVQTYHANLLNGWYLSSAWQKHWTIKIHPSKISNVSLPPFPPFNVIWKTLLKLLLVFVFTPSLFHFKLYKLLLTYSSCDCIAYELIKNNQFQIGENKPDETHYYEMS